MADVRLDTSLGHARWGEAAAMAAGLFALSFGTALFTLAIFKLLSFFVMPSLFFDLLFIGFPIGAVLGAKSRSRGTRPFVLSLWVLQAIMAASVAAGLLAKRMDYLRAHLFDVELPWLIAQVAGFGLLFLPFFAGYGLCEFLGYRLGRGKLGGKMRGVYALALFGAAAAFLFLRAALPWMGMARMLLCALAAVAAAALANSGRRGRRAAGLELAAIGVAMLVPGLEDGFLDLYKGHGVMSTQDFRNNHGCRNVYRKWGRYSLCEIMVDRTAENYYGFYNDMFQWEYSPRHGYSLNSLGIIPILNTKPGDRLAIIGSGGGRQVRVAQKMGGREIVAIELEPAVLEAVRSREHLLVEFGRVYEAKGVTPVRAEARGFLERSTERFDLIYLPSVGGYAQMMIEPGNMVRTFEAHRLMRDHLSDRGVLAIWYPSGLDHRGVLTDQYVRTLRLLGLMTQAYTNGSEYLVLGFRDPNAQPPSPEEMRSALHMDDPAAARFWPRRYEVAEDPRFTPITDAKPFLAGNVRHILSIGQVRSLIGVAAVVLAAAGLATWLGLRRSGDPQIPGRSFASVAGLSLLVGANFLVVEHLLVLGLFRRMFVYEDALGLGAVAFLTLSGLGSLISGGRARTPFCLLAAGALLPLLMSPGGLSTMGLIAAIAPAAVATGMFFPMLFDRAAANPIGVFAFDAIGAGIGAVAATFVPILWGFDAFFWLAAAMFLVTASANALFYAPPRAERGDARIALAAVT